MARQQIAADDHPQGHSKNRQAVVAAPIAPPVLDDSYSGIVRPRDVTNITVQKPVTVRRVLVSIGDRVAAGDAIVELADDESRHSTEQRRIDLVRATQHTIQLEQSVGGLDRSIRSLTVAFADQRAQLTIAERNAGKVPNREWNTSPQRAQSAYDQAVEHERRAAESVARGAGLQQLEEAQIAVRMAAEDLSIAKRAASARAEVDARQVELERIQAELALAEQHRAGAAGDLAQARVQQAQLESALEAAADRLDNLTVNAPAGGVAAEVVAKPGDRVQAGSPLLKLATIDPMVVDVAVPPDIVTALRRRQETRVRLSGVADEYEGHVLTISPLAGDNGTHAVEVELSNPSGALLAGRTARVRFVMSR
jgi:multidrug efflux pump subunit AcrA (membrane-fusion protein)